jgi:hypothetical protein
MLIDSAVDEKLAKSIFWEVSRGKRDSKSGIATVPLETLSLQVRGGERVLMHSSHNRRINVMEPFLDEIAHWWRVERDVRDDRHDLIHAVRDGPPPRRFVDDEFYHSPDVGDKVACETLAVFREIWPKKPQGSHWSDDWESWPLEKLGDE